MEIVKAEISDSKSIANLHKNEIPTGFLSQQSISFLSSLYGYLISNEIVYCVKENDRVLGFIAGTLTTKGLYKRFLFKNIRLLLKFILSNLFSLSFFQKALETLSAPKKTSVLDPDIELPELLSIVVDGKYKGKKIGQKLITVFENRLNEMNIKKYKVVVGSQLAANSFYLKNGFVKIKDFKLHKEELSNLYIKELSEEKYD